MRKVLMLGIIAVFVIAAASAFAGISATKHNLTSTGTGPHTTDTTNATLCGFCHIPHGGNQSVTNAPLWARSTRDTTGSPYTLYGGGSTLGGTTVGQPGTNSLTCLSCHDGTVALGVTYKNGVQAYNFTIVNGTGYTSGNKLSWTGYNANLAANNGFNPVIGGSAGSDLTNDHPVGITYDPTKAGLDTVANATSRNYKLYSGKVECASCHDPHISTTAKFKRNISGVDFCVGCHYNK